MKSLIGYINHFGFNIVLFVLIVIVMTGDNIPSLLKLEIGTYQIVIVASFKPSV